MINFNPGQILKQYYYGFSERLLEIYDGKKKMVADPHHSYFPAAWIIDCLQQWQCPGSFYLYPLLIAMKGPLTTMKKEKTLEAMLVIATGMMLIYFWKQERVFLYIAAATGIAGILIKPLAVFIAAGWYKAGELLGTVVSKVVLTLVFVFLLTPIALLYRIFNKDPLHLKKTDGPNWKIRGQTYSEKDLKNPW
jgi:hypothetical protein